MHKAISTSKVKSAKTLWVDEFTLFDFRALCIIISHVHPDRVVFVGGDHIIMRLSMYDSLSQP